MSDIGPGDVVEAVNSSSAPRGYRDVVVAIESTPCLCVDCGDTSRGLILSGLGGRVGEKTPRGVITHASVCAHHWRKIGGSRSDTVRQFAEDLNARRPAPIPTEKVTT